MFEKMAPFLRICTAVLAALAVGALFIAISGQNPFVAYGALFKGAFLDYYGFGNTLVRFSPILLAGLAVMLPLRAGLYNIGAEGQIYMGALLATMAALYLPEMPAWAHILLCSLGGILGGGLWALVPGLLRAYYNVNEVIVTLLMNYVAINIVSYAVSGPMMEAGAPYPYSAEIPDYLWLSYVLPGTDAHSGVLIGIFFALMLMVIFKYTTLGLSVDMVGANPKAARYTGISVRRTLIMTMVCGGALAGLAGAYEVLGIKYRLFHLFSHGYGYDGIVVAFLAANRPFFVIISSLFLSGLKAGGSIMQRTVGTEASIVEAIQGLVVIFVAIDVVMKQRGITFWKSKSDKSNQSKKGE